MILWPNHTALAYILNMYLRTVEYVIINYKMGLAFCVINIVESFAQIILKKTVYKLLQMYYCDKHVSG